VGEAVIPETAYPAIITGSLAVIAAIVTGLFLLLQRRGDRRRPAAAAYDELWDRVDLQDQRIAILGAGYTAAIQALGRLEDVHLTEQEKSDIDRARKMLTGELDLRKKG